MAERALSAVAVWCSCGIHISATDVTAERAYMVAYQFLQTHAFHEPYPTGKKD